MDDLIELLKNGATQSAIGLAALIVAGVAIWLQRKPKKILFFQLVTDVPLMTIRETKISGVSILFQGQPIANARVLVFRIINKGTAAIRAEDFESPMVVEVGAKARVLSAEIEYARPSNIAAKPMAIANTVNFQPCLLNSNDGFRCRILVDGATAPPRLLARAADTQVTDKAPPSRWKFIGDVANGLGLLLALVIFGAYTFFKSGKEPEWVVKMFEAVLYAGLGLMILGALISLVVMFYSDVGDFEK
jgi:hypothetical protein